MSTDQPDEGHPTRRFVEIRKGRSLDDLLRAAPPESSGPCVRDVSLEKFFWDEIAETMREGGYSLKMRSRWIEEAIAGLILFDPLLLQTNYEAGSVTARRYSKLESLDRTILTTKLTLRPEIDEQVRKLAVQLVRHEGDLKSPYSKVVRIAVNGRLGRPSKFPVGPSAESELIISRAMDAEPRSRTDMLWDVLELTAKRLTEQEARLDERQAVMLREVQRAVRANCSTRYRAMNGSYCIRSPGPRVLVMDRAKTRALGSQPLRPTKPLTILGRVRRQPVNDKD